MLCKLCPHGADLGQLCQSSPRLKAPSAVPGKGADARDVLRYEHLGRREPEKPARRWPGCLLAAALAGCLATSEPALSTALERDMTLPECILLAVRNNRDLAAGRLDRLAGRLTLEGAEDVFRPAADLDVAVRRDQDASALDVSPGVTLRIPTGGRFGLSANNRVTSEDMAAQFVELEFVQPLLKGGGVAVGTAGLVNARRTEQIGVLAFKSAVIGLVTRTIYAYRRVIRAVRAVEIAERSLQRARELLAVNRVLIEAGRMAEQDIVQTEASVAERELSLTETRDALDDAGLALLGILDIDDLTPIRPTEALQVDPPANDADRSVEVALRNRPDYQQALLGIENAETALVVADDARDWELDLSTSVRFGHSGRSLPEAYSRFDDDYGVGLGLRIPLGTNDARQRRNWQLARIAVRKARLRLEELRQAIDLEVRGAVRDVDVQLRRVELARQARHLAERKLEIERIKLNAGLSSNFRLVRFEDDLVRTQNYEVGAIIAYLNAVTALDQTLGTTLETWRIDIDPPTNGEAAE